MKKHAKQSKKDQSLEGRTKHKGKNKTIKGGGNTAPGSDCQTNATCN